MDVRDREQWRQALADFVEASGGRLDILFNNAGVARGGPFVLQSEADHDLVLDVNLKGVIYGAEAAFPPLKATPGSCLLNTCSAAGIYAGPGLAMYAASKFGVRALTESLNAEWEEHGIRVRSLMPSYIDTPLLDVATAGSNLNARETVRSMGLEFTPVEQVAEAAWQAAHGTRVHTIVGKTARRLAFVTRWAPFLLSRMRPPRPAQGEGA
jgi:NAD(P)-dependent dehydrogenase (short-subunit alcohol dehydrogenase family)